MQSTRSILCAFVCLALGASTVLAQPGGGKQKGGRGFPDGFKQSSNKKLQDEIERLRRDLDAAMREIAALKAAANGGKTPVDEGPLFRGRAAKAWLEQLKDEDDKTRADAIEAIGVLAKKDKKLIPVILGALKGDQGRYASLAVSSALVAIGPDVLTPLIDMAKDKNLKDGRQRAIAIIGPMREKAKPAVPALAKILADPHIAVARAAVLALGQLGPDAKEAIPDLVNLLGDCIADAGKPGTFPLRFGDISGSTNHLIVSELFYIDPQLGDVLARPRPDLSGFGGKRKKGSVKGNETVNAPSRELIDTWLSIHATLVKRYGKTK